LPLKAKQLVKEVTAIAIKNWVFAGILVKKIIFSSNRKQKVHCFGFEE
jgi:hypothetical protein